MNTSELNSIVDQTFQSIQKLLVVKGGEYANSEDRLANFKRGSALTGATPMQVLFVYLSKHYDGVASFVKSSATGKVRPSSEPIEGRLDDMINYCILLKGLLQEERNRHVQAGVDGGLRKAFENAEKNKHLSNGNEPAFVPPSYRPLNPSDC